MSKGQRVANWLDRMGWNADTHIELKAMSDVEFDQQFNKCASCKGQGYHESHNQICVCDCQNGQVNK